MKYHMLLYSLLAVIMTSASEKPIIMQDLPKFNFPEHAHITFIINGSKTENHLAQMLSNATGTSQGTSISHFKEFLWQNKGTLAGASLVGVYSGTCLAIFKMQATIQSSQAWSSWKSDKSLNDLLSIGQDTLTSELINEIQSRYTNKKNPLDLIMPLALFITALNNEETSLTYYKSTVSGLQKLGIARLFPLKQSCVNSIDDRIGRVRLLRNYFTEWCKQQHIAQRKKSFARSMMNFDEQGD